MYENLQLSIILFGFVVFLIYIYLTINFNYWKKRGVIGPKPKVLFGNFPNIIYPKRHVAYDMDDIYREYKGRESFVGIYMTRNPQVLLLDNNLVRSVLITNFKNFHDNELSYWINEEVDTISARNPFLMKGNAWKEKRSEIGPALTTIRVKAMYPVLEEVCRNLTKYLENITKNPPKDGVNTKELSTRFTTQVISNCIYGIETDAFSNENCAILKAGENMIDDSFKFIFYIMAASVFPIIKKIISVRFFEERSNIFYTKLITDAIELRLSNKSDRTDFLNYLLELKEKKNLPILDMAAHAMTFFFDGFETSSLAMTHCLLMIAKHKDIQERLRDEINEYIDDDGKISFEKISEMPYLEQCFNETLRLFSPVMFTTKMCTEPFQMYTSKEKKVLIEKGMRIQVPIYSIHHDEEYYPDPFKFDPERMTSDKVKKLKDMGVFLPFGDGPRICLGMKFGVTQTKAAIVEIIRNWEITVNEKTRKDYTVDKNHFLARLDGGIWLNFECLKS